MIKKLFRQMLVTQIVSSMTVTLCMLIDSIMIGRFLGVDAMSAYGLASPLLLVFAAFGSLISAGVQVMCGKTVGAGDREGTDACYTDTLLPTARIIPWYLVLYALHPISKTLCRMSLVSTKCARKPMSMLSKCLLTSCRTRTTESSPAITKYCRTQLITSKRVVILGSRRTVPTMCCRYS